VARYIERFAFKSELLQAMYAVTDGFSGLNGGWETPGTGMNFLAHNMVGGPGGGLPWGAVAAAAAAAVAPTPTGFKGRAVNAAMAASNSKTALIAPKTSTFHSNNPLLVKGLELKGRASPPLTSTPPPSPPHVFESFPGSPFKGNPLRMGRR
jgi:hypothetical protein